MVEKEPKPKKTTPLNKKMLLQEWEAEEKLEANREFQAQFTNDAEEWPNEVNSRGGW